MSNVKGESEMNPTESKTPSTVGNFLNGSGESPATSPTPMEGDRSGKMRSHLPDMHVAGQSHSSIVPERPANNEDVPACAESVEERGLTNENIEQSLLLRTPSREKGEKPPERRSRGLLGVREAAQKDRKKKFTNLLHHDTPELLRASFFALKKFAAARVDNEMWTDYALENERRLTELRGRIHRGACRAQPSRRTCIPKPDGRMRPPGIAALEDKIVQQAVRTVLECIYEQDFPGFSYGFRPRRGCHQALGALIVGIKERNVNWIIDACIRGFPDNISHEGMMKFLEHRIADRRMLRLLKKWLRAGVSEDGKWSSTTVGTPQGEVISPLLSKVFLHYVLDLWINDWRKRHAHGEVIVVRYADDFVIGFSNEADARECLAALEERMTRFGLELHPEKTRLIEFGRQAMKGRTDQNEAPLETFDFLGFTHICGTTRKGWFTIHHRTARKEFHAKLADLKMQLARTIHIDLAETGAWLRQVCQGWCQYYAVPGNYVCLQRFQKALQRMWLTLLRRRSQRGRRLTWTRFSRICKRWLPDARILHPCPEVRFACQPQR